MFVDTHTHLFTKEFDEDRSEVVQAARDAGIDLMLLPNIDVSSISRLDEMTKDFQGVCIGMMGLHPGNVDAKWQQELETIRQALFSNDNYCAVGEIGMDLYWDKTYLEAQKEVFRTQLEWAKELEKPVAIHAREAFDAIFEIMDEVNDDRLTGVFHCFTGNLDQAKHALSYGGFKLGIGGVVTFKNGGLDRTLIDVPLDELVLETDSPYLAPTPFRGKRNETKYLLHVAAKLAAIYDVPLKEVERVTMKNAVELFKLEKYIP